MQYLKAINQVRKITVNNAGVSLLNEQGVVSLDVNALPKVILPGNFDFLYGFKSLLFIDSNQFIEDGQVKTIDELKSFCFFNVCYKDKCTFNDENGNVILFDIESQKIVSENINPYTDRGLSQFTDDNSALFIGDNFLAVHNVFTHGEKWKLYFQSVFPYENPSLFGNIILSEGKLFVFLSNFNKSITFCINAETGEIVKQIEPFGGHLTIHKDHIYVANPYNVRMLNVNTFEVTTVELNDILEPLGWNMMWHKFAVQDNKFYFVHQQAGGGDEAIVGIIDLVKKELLWHTVIPIEEGSYWVSDIQVNDNKLFVLTQGGTLHIFEQE